MGSLSGLNTFITLPVPAADGLGSTVDVSGLTADKNLMINSDNGFDGEFTILATHNGTNFAPVHVIRGQPNVPVKVSLNLDGTYQQLRVFRRAFGDSPTMGIAGQATCACS